MTHHPADRRRDITQRVKRVLLVPLAALLSAGAILLSALSAAAEEIKPYYRPLDIKYVFDKLDVLTYFTKPLKQRLAEKNIDLDFMAGVMQGYDNNAYLDPSRKKDAYLDTSFSADVAYRYTDNIRLETGFSVYSLLYYDATDNDVLDMSGAVGPEIDVLDDKLTLQPEYEFEWVLYPNDCDSTYYLNGISLFVQNNVTARFYQRAGYRLELRSYTDRITFGPDANKSGDLETHARNTVEYELSFKPLNFFKVKQNLQFYRNDSNNQYYDYYDYYAFREKTTVLVSFTEKLYSLASFVYIRKLYDDRLSTGDFEHEKDNLYLLNVSVFYDITKSFTLAASFAYRENTSNEPLEKYSGSLFSIGCYYVF